VRPLDRQLGVLAADAAVRGRALNGRQHAKARRMLGAIHAWCGTVV
jgi:hypothetical protein